MKKKLKTKSDKSRSETALKETSPLYRNRGKTGTSKAVEDQGWIDFRDQCRRQMKRPIELRIKYGFYRTYKPVLDDAKWRTFESMAEYRAWCAANLPEYLGYKPADK